MEVRTINDWVMAVKLVIEGLTVNIISTYMLQVGLDEEVKKHF